MKQRKHLHTKVAKNRKPFSFCKFVPAFNSSYDQKIRFISGARFFRALCNEYLYYVADIGISVSLGIH